MARDKHLPRQQNPLTLAIPRVYALRCQAAASLCEAAASSRRCRTGAEYLRLASAPVTRTDGACTHRDS